MVAPILPVPSAAAPDLHLQEVLRPGREECESIGFTHAPLGTMSREQTRARPPCPGLRKPLCGSKVAETPVPAALLGGGPCVCPSRQPLGTVPRKGRTAHRSQGGGGEPPEGLMTHFDITSPSTSNCEAPDGQENGSD